MSDDTLDIPVCCPGEGEDEMADAAVGCDAGNLCVAQTAMANGMANVNQMLGMGFAGSADRRTQRADQISGDSQSMWSIAMTSPTASSALGFRTATESGSGSARYAPYVPPTGQVAQ